MIYYPHFQNTNPDCFEPDNREKLDAHRMARFTAWTPERGPDLAFVTPFNIDEPDDRMDLCINAEMWLMRKPEVHIGVYNVREDKQPVTFDIKVREFSTYSCLPEDLQVKNEVFKLVHEGTDAHSTSDQERNQKNL